MKSRNLTMVFACLSLAGAAFGQTCWEYLQKVTLNIVSDWKLSKHSPNHPDADLTGDVPGQPGLRPVVRLERDGPIPA